MKDILTSITNAAVTVFREKSSSTQSHISGFNLFGSSDSILREAQKVSVLPPDTEQLLSELTETLFNDPDLKDLAPVDGELDPMIMHPGGGFRTPPDILIKSIFSSAFLYIFYLRLSNDENTYVRTVLENFDELKRAVKGENIRGYLVKGLAGVSIRDGSQVSMPWGILRPAPQVESDIAYFRLGQPETKCILAEQMLIPILFDRAEQPENRLTKEQKSTANTDNLMQLSCALASKDLSKPIAPLLTWSTLLLPFQSGFSYSQHQNPHPYISDSAIDDRISDIEEWARIINTNHSSKINISVQRLVSAIVHRSDKTDALIDSVMVWENLLGTHDEVTFRVSAALAMLIESNDSEKRKALYKELKSIYGLRSKIVHGASVDAGDINIACTRAIEIAIEALRISYKNGSSWLEIKSSERSDRILLKL